ncbi:MAG: hypothetical protein JJT94_08255 [Bernardetiaceae bacterium]|nr:hypothetical protein [Bernardetiaceae bacterium]
MRYYFTIFCSYFALCFLAFLYPNNKIFAQQNLQHQGFYQLDNGMNGNASYSYLKIEKNDTTQQDSIVLNGSFKFDGDNFKENNCQNLERIEVAGKYTENLKNGNWIYRIENYDLNLNAIDKNLRVNSSLDGHRKTLRADYENGYPHNKWTFLHHNINNGRLEKNQIKSEVSCNLGFAQNAFDYFNALDKDRTPIQVKGQFDEEGNLHGTWEIYYAKTQEEKKTKEVRKYQNGFLLRIQIIENYKDANPNILSDVIYHDVITKLEALEKGEDTTNIRIGKRQFGLLFNNGYNPNTSRINAQKRGNKIIENALEPYKDSSHIQNYFEGHFPMVIGMTKRFQFVYPAQEDSLLKSTQQIIHKLQQSYDSILNSSQIILYKREDDSLALGYAFIELAKQKTEKVWATLENLKSEEFDYSDRNNFYNKGIEGLKQKTDSITYDYDGKNRKVAITFKSKIAENDNIAKALYDYSKALEKQSQEYFDYMKEALKDVMKEQRILELDSLIILNTQKVAMQYIGKTHNKQNITKEDLPEDKDITDLQLKVYQEIALNKQNELIKLYNNAENRNDKMQVGEEIINWHILLKDAYPILEYISRMPESLDSAFTEYKENPFDRRLTESRIRPNIYNKAVNRLLPEMVNAIPNSRKLADFKQNIEEIVRLDKRLREFATSDPKSEEVRKLNIRLRSENVPERIKRLLGL